VWSQYLARTDSINIVTDAAMQIAPKMAYISRRSQTNKRFPVSP
jgi:hypothetical protein